MNKSIAVIRGDGIGPEIVGEAIRVLDAVAAKFGHTFTYHEAPMGGNAIDAFGVPLPDSSLETCLNCDSVLLGAVGGPKWDAQPSGARIAAAAQRHGPVHQYPARPDVRGPLRGLPAAQRYCRPGY